MTASAVVLKSRTPRPSEWPQQPRPVTPAATVPVPPLSPRLQLVRGVLVMVCVLSVAMLIQLVLVSSLQHNAAKGRAYASFRAELAKGTAPIGPTDADGHELAIGTSVAYLEIPGIDVEEVIGEGTTASALFDGPGHRRDTPLPGQVGTSVVYGRRASYGGPFAGISELAKGDLITVSTGQGVFEYRVIGVRAEGQPVPPPPGADESRLLLVTADGTAFLPGGVLRVDAELVGQAVIGPARIISAAALPANERVMAVDTSTLWALALWMQVLIALSIGVVWAWHRWGRAQTWVVFLPPLILVGLMTAGEAARLLPNLL
jgi:sortase A